MGESTNRVVLVTGAGRGLGRAIADRYRAAGFTVVATDYDDSLLADISGSEGYITARQDVTDIERAAEIATLIRERCGRLDVIVTSDASADGNLADAVLAGTEILIFPGLSPRQSTLFGGRSCAPSARRFGDKARKAAAPL